MFNNFLSTRAVLMAVHGVIAPEAANAYDNIEKVIKNRFGDLSFYRAYTSSYIMKKLAEQGVRTNSLSKALMNMRNDGIKHAVVQLVSVSKGDKHEEIIKEIEAFRGSFTSLKTGMPLLNSSSDIDCFSKCAGAVIPAKRNMDEAVVFMCHGDRKNSNGMLFKELEARLKEKDKNIFIAALTAGMPFENVRTEIKSSGIKRAYLMPMMIVAGKHAHVEFCGSGEYSWKSVLEKDGVECISVLKGLGEYDIVASIFADRLKDLL